MPERIPEEADVEEFWYIGRDGPVDKETRLVGWCLPGTHGAFSTYEEAVNTGKSWLLDHNLWGVSSVWRVTKASRLLVCDLTTYTPPGFYNRGFGSW